MNAPGSPTPHSSGLRDAAAVAKGERSVRGVRSLLAQVVPFSVQGPKAAQIRHQVARLSFAFERRTTADCVAQRSNPALLTDTDTSPLRAQRGAAKRGR
jgi:hypothetical protein